MYRHRLALAAILLVAALPRFFGVSWDGGYYAHPDEGWVADVTTRLLRWPEDLSELRDPATSPMNIRRDELHEGGNLYTYGTLMPFALKAVSSVAARLSGQPELAEVGGVYRVARPMAALADVITVLLVYLIGRRLFDRRVGLLAAAFLGLTVVHIQQAHFYVAEPLMTMLLTAALHQVVRALQERSAWSVGWAGLLLGAAVGVKPSAAAFVPGALLILFAGALLASREAGDRDGRRGVLRGLLLAGLAGGLSLVAWALSEPYAVLDLGPYLEQVSYESRIQRGIVDVPYTRQYIGTVPVLYHLGQYIRWGVGFPLGLAVLGGIGWALYRLARGRDARIALLLGWIAPYTASILLLEAKWLRYMVPITPVLLLLASAALWGWYDRVARPSSARRGAAPSPVPGSAAAGLGGTPATATTALSAVGAEPREGRREAAGAQVGGEGAGARGVSTGGDVPARRLYGGWRRAAPVAAMGAALLGSALYAIAHTTIYTRPHNWVAASAWIYKNIPDGATIGREHWDTDLPLRLPGEDRERYDYCCSGEPPSVPRIWMYDDLPPGEKLEQVREALAESDYIVLASNRIYDTVPKSPWRYAVATRYYELLFAERLGYELVYRNALGPSLGPLEVSAEGADDNVAVYDHPTVHIFQKVRDLAPRELEALFRDALEAPWIPERHASAERSLRTPPRMGAVTSAPLYDATRPELQGRREDARRGGGAGGADVSGATASVTQSTLSAAAVTHPYLEGAWDTGWSATLAWLLTLEGLGLAAWLLLGGVWRGLRDRGWVIAKLLGLVLVAWAAWVLPALGVLLAGQGLTRFIAVVLGAVALVAALVRRRELRADLRSAWRAMLGFELLFLGMFAAGVLLRAANPDLWHPSWGGEKPMELAHLNGILRSANVPPYDPWFAGGQINYYYWGQWLVASVMWLADVGPHYGFNLGVATVLALTGTLAAAVGYALAARSGARPGALVGALSLAFVLLLGNLDGAVQAVERVARGDALASLWREFDFWRSSRLPEPDVFINEFPFFTFLYGDLHAHMVAMPLALGVLLLGLTVVLREPGYGPPPLLSTLIPAALAGLLVGALVMTNPWDVPAYGGLFALALVWAALRTRTGNRQADDGEASPSFARDGVAGRAQGRRAGMGTRPYATPTPASTARTPNGGDDRAEDAGRGAGRVWGPAPTAAPPSAPNAGVWALLTIAPGVTRMHRRSLDPALGASRNGEPVGLPEALGAAGGETPHRRGETPHRLVSDAVEATAATRPPRRLLAVLPPLLVFGLVAALVALPFLLTFKSFYGAVGLVADPTPLGIYLNMVGLFLFVVLWYGVLRGRKGPLGGALLAGAAAMLLGALASPPLRLALLAALLLPLIYVALRMERRARRDGLALALLLLAAGALGLAIGDALRRPVLALILGLLALVLYGAWRARHEPAELAWAGLAAGGLLIWAGIETVYLKDFLDGSDYYRQNTVFKFGLQAWFLLALGAAGLLWVAVRAARPGLARAAPLGLAVALIAASLVYPVYGGADRLRERFPEPPPGLTLDGERFMATARLRNISGRALDFSHDLNAIDWLRRNVPVPEPLAEASIGPYRGNGGRVSMFTGLPALVGWNVHESQQRYPDEVSERDGEVRELYDTRDPRRAIEIIARYGVRWIYVGPVERLHEYDASFDSQRPEPYASPAGLRKFDRLVGSVLRVAYRNPGVTIYEVLPSARWKLGTLVPEPSALGPRR